MDFTAGEKIARRHWLYKWRQIIVKNFAKSVRYSCARWEPRGGGGRGINCAQRVIYQFPRGSSLLFTEMIPIRGIVVRIFWRRTLTPTEGWERDRTRRVRGGESQTGREGSRCNLCIWVVSAVKIVSLTSRITGTRTPPAVFWHLRVRAMLKIMRKVVTNVRGTLAWHALINSCTLLRSGKDIDEGEHIATSLKSLLIFRHISEICLC